MPSSPEEIRHLMKLYRSNTCVQSNLNWVMVLHHVTVARQLTASPLLCVGGCNMSHDWWHHRGSGTRRDSITKSFSSAARADQPTWHMHAWTLVHTCIRYKHTLTFRTASCSSCSNQGTFSLHCNWSVDENSSFLRWSKLPAVAKSSEQNKWTELHMQF